MHHIQVMLYQIYSVFVIYGIVYPQRPLQMGYARKLAKIEGPQAGECIDPNETLQVHSTQ